MKIHCGNTDRMILAPFALLEDEADVPAAAAAAADATTASDRTSALGRASFLDRSPEDDMAQLASKTLVLDSGPVLLSNP